MSVFKPSVSPWIHRLSGFLVKLSPLTFLSFSLWARQVSLMSKLVPSPDWFVGIDSLDLCENGRLIDALTVEVMTKEEYYSMGKCQSSWITLF